jgi:hypothetical protein
VTFARIALLGRIESSGRNGSGNRLSIVVKTAAHRAFPIDLREKFIAMRRVLRDNGLSLAMLGLFLLFLAGQSVAGWLEYNDELREHRGTPASFASYFATGHFWEALFENWESEFLQMAGYVFFTAILIQRGSAESKDPDKPEPPEDDPELHRNDPDAPWPVRRGGLWLTLYSHSLSLAFAVLFLLSLTGHAFGGLAEENQERRDHNESTITIEEYVTSSAFWFESFQNWQSEFLAVSAMVLLSIWLRERNSSESKPVVRPHRSTGNE